MGGMVALAYLGRPPADRPAEPDGLVLAATAPADSQSAASPASWPAPQRTCCAGSPARDASRTVRLLTTPLRATLALQSGAHPRSTLSALFTTALAATTSLDTAVGFLPGLRSYDQTSTLGSVSAETIVLSGGADLLTPPSHAHEMAAAIPGATHLSPSHRRTHAPSRGFRSSR